MKALNLVLISSICALAIFAPWLVRHRAATVLREKQTVFQTQAMSIDELSKQNQQLSNITVQAASPASSDEAQLAELMKLRSEITQLQQTPEQMEELRKKIARLKERMRDADEERSYPTSKDTALLADEMPVRQARVARMKQWLQANPGENIPEMQFVAENRWIDRAAEPLITDDDYRSAIGLLREDGEMHFVPMLYNAVKQYAGANGGQFPSDVEQLKPYFQTTVEDAMLERWTVVPASSLVPILAGTGGDWLITEKAPINSQFDARDAIGLKSYRGTVEDGRWDPVQ